jgi:hypothetical protein
MDASQERSEPLERLAAALIAAALAGSIPGAREGRVQASGRAPYRRIDCDGRALALVRVRPARCAVRVDVPAHRSPPRGARLAVAGAAGVALLVRADDEIAEVVAYLSLVIARVRADRVRCAERARSRAQARAALSGRGDPRARGSGDRSG